MNLFDGGTFSPGNSAGQVSAAAASFQAGGSYVFEIHDAVGMPGTGYDFMNIAGGLTIAAGNTPNSQFTIDVVSLNASNQPGTTVNFNPSQAYSFVLASAVGGITGFSADMFQVDVHSFSNNLAGGTFHVSQSSNELLLNFVPAALTGDYNHNGVVDAADYVVWRKLFGQTGPGLPADGDGNLVVNELDYDYWRARFGNTYVSGAASSANASIPEPSSILLLGLSAVGAFLLRRRSGV